MEKLQSDSDRNAVASYWSAAIEANLEENVDTPSDRLRFASYATIKRIDGADDVNDTELSAELEAQLEVTGEVVDMS
jgi:hypothetical protein